MFVFNSSKEHPGNLRVQSFRSLVTNPSLVGQLSTSKFLASLPPINGINETSEQISNYRNMFLTIIS